MAQFDGPKMADARMDRGWTQQELATEAGVSKATISRVESSGRCHPAQWRKLCDALGIHAGDELTPKERHVIDALRAMDPERRGEFYGLILGTPAEPAEVAAAVHRALSAVRKLRRDGEAQAQADEAPKAG